MKKIIKGKVYDTDTARLVGQDDGELGSFRQWKEWLYQKRTGEFFLHGQGGPASKYAVSCGLNQWEGGEKLIPLDVEATRQWVEAHLGADDYEALFGAPDEDDAERTAISALLPAGLVKRARQRAADDKTTLTAVLEAALVRYLGQ